LQDHVENEWKDDVDERGDEAIKHVEICPHQATWRRFIGQNRRVGSERAWREKLHWIKLGHLTDYD